MQNVIFHVKLLSPTLKHVVWRFREFNLFHEIFKFRENMNMRLKSF